MAFDRLDRDVKLAGHLLVGVPLGDQPQDLAFAGGQLVQFRVERRPDVRRRRGGGERVEHESRQPVREHRVAAGHPPDGVGQVGGGDRLGDVAPGPGPDNRDHVLRGVRGRQRQELNLGVRLLHLGDDRVTAAARQVHVEQHDVGELAPDQLDGGGDVIGLAHDLDLPAELGPHPRAEQAVVIDQDDPRHALVAAVGRAHRRRPSAAAGPAGARPRAIVSVTFVPSPSVDCTVALPPCLSIRPRMDSATPLRSAGTEYMSTPLPRSLTATSTLSGSTSAKTEITLAPDHLAALTVASLAAASSALRCSACGRWPTVTTSTGPPCLASTSRWISLTPSANEVTSVSPGARPSNSHDLSSRSCARASCTTVCGSSALRWISARVCSPESCPGAPMSPRSSPRPRACRSNSRSRAIRSHHGPRSTTMAAATSRNPPSGASRLSPPRRATSPPMPAMSSTAATTNRSLVPRRTLSALPRLSSGSTRCRIPAFSSSGAFRQMSVRQATLTT